MSKNCHDFDEEELELSPDHTFSAGIWTLDGFVRQRYFWKTKKKKKNTTPVKSEKLGF